MGSLKYYFLPTIEAITLIIFMFIAVIGTDKLVLSICLPKLSEWEKYPKFTLLPGARDFSKFKHPFNEGQFNVNEAK